MTQEVKKQTKRCETCAIPWDYRQSISVLNPNYKRKYPECPIQYLRDAVGSSLVGSITAKISCEAWVQISCCKCGKLVDGEAYEYCGRPYCTPCGSGEDYFDEEYS
jgi:hypothetical protein